jgi:hypothetical protein
VEAVSYLLLLSAGSALSGAGYMVMLAGEYMRHGSSLAYLCLCRCCCSVLSTLIELCDEAEMIVAYSSLLLQLIASHYEKKSPYLFSFELNDGYEPLIKRSIRLSIVVASTIPIWRCT